MPKFTARAAAIVAAGTLALAVLLPSMAVAADPVYATVTGHANGDAANNQADHWGPTCTKLETGWAEDGTWVLDKDYLQVIVKVGGDASVDYPNTIFDNPKAGETVWADTNGNNEYDPKTSEYKDGDKASISHIIVCTAEVVETPTEAVETPTEAVETPTEAVETPTEAVETPTEAVETPTDEVLPTSVQETATPSSEALPNSDTINKTGTPSNGLPVILVLGIGALAVILLATAPAAKRNRR